MFIIDHYHLKKSGLENHFMVNGYEIFQEHLHPLIKAKSEVIFNSILDSARDFLKQQNPCDGELESKL